MDERTRQVIAEARREIDRIREKGYVDLADEAAADLDRTEAGLMSLG